MPKPSSRRRAKAKRLAGKPAKPPRASLVKMARQKAQAQFPDHEFLSCRSGDDYRGRKYNAQRNSNAGKALKAGRKIDLQNGIGINRRLQDRRKCDEASKRPAFHWVRGEPKGQPASPYRQDREALRRRWQQGKLLVFISMGVEGNERLG